MKRAVWVDAGSNVDKAKLARYGIDSPYFDPRDPRVTPAFLDTVKAQGFKPGLYFAWNWYPVTTGAAFADTVDAELRQLGWAGNPPVCIDIEKGDGLTDTNVVAYVVSFFQRWRQLRPKRETDYTLEGFQGGLFTPAAVRAIVAANVQVCPQFYAGNMSALGHSPTVDLLMAGFPGERLDGMYDAAALPWRWRGYAFTQGRLP